MSMRYLLCEAAAYFNAGGLSGMLREPVERRAEMMAHVLIKEAREGYAEWKRQQKSKKKEQAKKGFNPAEAQRRRWMTGGNV